MWLIRSAYGRERASNVDLRGDEREKEELIEGIVQFGCFIEHLTSACGGCGLNHRDLPHDRPGDKNFRRCCYATAILFGPCSIYVGPPDVRLVPLLVEHAAPHTVRAN